MAAELLSELRNAGLRLSRNGDQLTVTPRESLTDELRAAIRTGKMDLLAALRAEQGAALPKDATLDRVQKAARRRVLAQLKAHPTIKRAFVNRFEPDGTMIVTLAIRGVGTGELKIPAARFNQASRDDYAALLGCIKGAAI
jgi:hypothetical protein